jgi:hypothetical protein
VRSLLLFSIESVCTSEVITFCRSLAALADQLRPLVKALTADSAATLRVVIAALARTISIVAVLRERRSC